MSTQSDGIRTQRLDRDGGTVAFDDTGSGPLIVLVPGLGDLRQEYRFLRPMLLDAGYRVVTVDLRGHGESSVGWPDYSSSSVGNDLLALIEHLDAGPALIVGNSFGAGPAVWAAAEEPSAVAGIALIGPFVRNPEKKGFLVTLAMNVLFRGPWRVSAWSWYYGTLFTSRKPADFDGYREALARNLRQPGRFEALRAMLTRSDEVIEARLASVRRPALVIMGSRDPDFPDPAREARWVAGRLGGEFEMIEGAGHYPQAEMPEATAAHLIGFARRIRHRSEVTTAWPSQEPPAKPGSQAPAARDVDHA